MARQFFIKDKNLKGENIKQGVKILNVTGTYEGDCEERPSLLGVNNAQSSTHASVVFDTGFPIASLINNAFEGYFSLRNLETESFFLLGNRSNIDPETGYHYYWGIWKYQDKLIVSFGSLSQGHNDCAVFTLDDEVSSMDLPISWVRMENPDYGTSVDEYGTEYIYEVKVGNMVKYAPAFDDRLEFFDGLNVCVFGRNTIEYSDNEFGASAPNWSLCSGLFLSSTDGDDATHNITLDPYVKNGTATLYKRYDIDGEIVEGPLEPVRADGSTYFDNFGINYGQLIEITPSVEEQHIATVEESAVTPYVTVLPMNLTSASETITENGQVVISAGDYNVDGISEITLDISVGGGGGGDWLVDALAGNITDLSGYELPAPTHDYQYSHLLYKYPITAIPDMSNWTSITGFYAMSYSFSDSSITSVDFSNVTSISSELCFDHSFSECTALTFVDFSSLRTVSGNSCFAWCFSGCTNLATVHLDSLAHNFNNNLYRGIFSRCSNLKTVYISADALAGQWMHDAILIDVDSIENLYLTNNATDDIRLIWQPNLTAASVLNVLTHLDLTVSGKSVSFYSSGLTVTDDAQGSIQDAYDAAVAAGWTINNLTIVQP